MVFFIHSESYSMQFVYVVLLGRKCEGFRITLSLEFLCVLCVLCAFALRFCLCFEVLQNFEKSGLRFSKNACIASFASGEARRSRNSWPSSVICSATKEAVRFFISDLVRRSELGGSAARYAISNTGQSAGRLPQGSRDCSSDPHNVGWAIRRID